MLLERLAVDDGLKGALLTIDAIACNATIAKAVRAAGADYLLAVKDNQPSLRREIELCFEDAQASVERFEDVDKGHGRIETRTVSVVREVEWLAGARRFPGELRLPHVAAILKVESRTELKNRRRFETRYYITSAPLAPAAAAAALAIRGHWGIENQLHWVLDVVFGEDQSRLRKGHGAKNMAVVRHFALNQVRVAEEPLRPPGTGLRRPRKVPSDTPRKTSIKLRRKVAGWNLDYLETILGAKVC